MTTNAFGLVDLDTETAAALDHARDLARHGVPIFLARPATDGAGQWVPDGGHNGCGYWLPNGWQHTTADPAVLDQWRPGIAVAAVMGHGVDGLDVDPRHCGDQSQAALAAAGCWPRSLGRQATPSGGWHDLCNPLHVASRDDVAPGVDVKAGHNGASFGFLFLAPSVKLSKETGEVAAYRWTVPPTLDELDPDDDSGQPLAERIRALRADTSDDAPDVPHDAHDAMSEPQRAAVARYLVGVARGIGDEMAEAATWHEGQRDDRNRGWQKVTADVCNRLGRLARADWTPWTYTDARQVLQEATPARLAAAVGLEATWSAQRGRRSPAPFPASLAADQWVASLHTLAGARNLAPASPVNTDTGEVSDDHQPEPAPLALSRLKRGGSFILDAPDTVPSVWGEGERVVWAQGEALMLAGPAGVGKTTLSGQVVRARVGLGDGQVLGMAVAPTSSRVLYLAMDRPRQIARALRRVFSDVDRATLDEHLVVWEGPPLADLAKHPEELLGLCQLAGADTVVVDSLKDAAIGLSDDEVGAGYNRARQLCIAAGVEVLELHHMVKRGANGNRPTSLADLYGSVWLGAGAGSVLLLWGAAGDPIVELSHLKQPAAEVGPFKVMHDHEAGTSHIWHATDLLTMAKASGKAGLTAKAAARALFSTESPSSAEVEKARRRLVALARGDSLTFTEGDRASAKAAVWTFTDTFTAPSETFTDTFTAPSETFTDTFTAPSETVTLHGSTTPSRQGESEHETTFTDTFTTFTGPDLHGSPPARRAGEREVSTPAPSETTTTRQEYASLEGCSPGDVAECRSATCDHWTVRYGGQATGPYCDQCKETTP